MTEIPASNRAVSKGSPGSLSSTLSMGWLAHSLATQGSWPKLFLGDIGLPLEICESTCFPRKASISFITLLEYRHKNRNYLLTLYSRFLQKTKRHLYFFQQILFHNNNGERADSFIIKDTAETLKTSMH